MKRTLVGLAAAVLAGAALGGAVPAGAAPTTEDTRPASRRPDLASGAANQDAASAEGVALLVLPIEGEEAGLGDQVRLMLINKAKRLRAVVYDPGSAAEVLGPGDAVSVDTPPEKLAALGRDKFKADLVVAGSVKGKGPYVVRLVAVRTRTGQPLVLDKTYSCGYHQVIPLEMAKAVYEIFGMRIPDDPLRMLREDPQIERRWREGPNLVRNPGYEMPNAAGNGPADWQATGNLPTGGKVAWIPNPDGTGKVIKFEMDEGTAGGYGMAWYSDWIEIQPGATYRFSCRYKSEGPTPKIFLKGYHAFPPQEGFPAQRRETYRRQVHPSGEKGQWNSVVADFIPEATRPDQQPTFLKVDLYAYWPKGVIYWDDIVLKKVRDAPAAAANPASATAKPAAGAEKK